MTLEVTFTPLFIAWGKTLGFWDIFTEKPLGDGDLIFWLRIKWEG